MYNILQTLLRSDGKLVLFLGFNMKDDDEGFWYKDEDKNIYNTKFKPEYKYSPIYDKDGSINVGKVVDDERVRGHYFGLFGEEYRDKMKPDLTLKSLLDKQKEYKKLEILKYRLDMYV